MIAVNTHFLDDPLPDYAPRFRPGDVVEHVGQRYRGVVVAVDGHCRADPAWYFGNPSQPDRRQPWYHVLVDGTDRCTYPAEENLNADLGGLPVTHPLLDRYFRGRRGGRYVRNGVAWGGV